MQVKHWSILFIAAALTLTACVSFGDDEDDDDGKFWKRTPGVAPVSNSLYTEECGSCHFAYQPGFLPERSWQQLMQNLDDHFGDNAELAANVHQQIQQYLVANSADKSSHRRSRKMMRSIADSSTPLRITDTRYFKKEHDEIPARLVKGNEHVRSFSNCDSCHQSAKSGSFSERDIKIAGYGRWDD